MCHKNRSHLHRRVKGSALVIAIFIIVVMSLLGAALVKMLATSAESIVYEVLGTRAYNAAQIGIQWQIQQIFPLDGDPPVCINNDASRPDLSAIKGLEKCQIIALTCSATDITTMSINLYTVTSTGVCNINGVLTSRKLEVQAKSTN